MNADMIQAEHDRLGHQYGWRFLMGPERTLGTASVAVVTLNPGGRSPEGARWSVEEGSAYEIEDWRKPSDTRGRAGQKPLQRQVQRMMALAGVSPADALAAVFVPFRSPRWADLAEPEASLAFARRLWAWALSQSPATLIICVGKGVVAPELAKILGGRRQASRPCGWKGQSIDTWAADGRALIALPHLSTFKMFGRPESDEAFRRVLDAVRR